jgi:hypothetical protein
MSTDIAGHVAKAVLPVCTAHVLKVADYEVVSKKRKKVGMKGIFPPFSFYFVMLHGTFCRRKWNINHTLPF